MPRAVPTFLIKSPHFTNPEKGRCKNGTKWLRGREVDPQRAKPPYQGPWVRVVDKIQCSLGLASGENWPHHKQFAGLSANLVWVLRRKGTRLAFSFEVDNGSAATAGKTPAQGLQQGPTSSLLSPVSPPHLICVLAGKETVTSASAECWREREDMLPARRKLKEGRCQRLGIHTNPHSVPCVWG